ncbi:cytochrome P450 [Herbidospora sp. NBRC 101105]|uniref:cytochrome P450 n=1 Tax=Herbidospora sp. NBRC 101105 TaxID=3032195 RepID=UPI0024A10BBB|nr:cytochrome P450 [Herbidospora sp. NBRC 101105]GLX96473.1 cytochrome P450 [Herbidospora sp. NBRC 101105]
MSGGLVYEIDLAATMGDPFGVYGRAREAGPLAVLRMPGAPEWMVVTRYDDIRAALTDPRLEIRPESFMRPDVPDDCLPYMRTMSEMNGAEHARLRKAAAPAFTPRRAEAFRTRITEIVGRLLDPLDGETDLIPAFTRPLPMDVICALVGVPEDDRERWRAHGRVVDTPGGPGFAAAIPGIMDGAKAAVARRRAEPGDDLLSDLVATELTDQELVTLVWHLILAGQTPTNLIANAVLALLTHPAQLAVLRDRPGLMPRAVEELTRFCGPTILSIPRYAREPMDLCGVEIAAGTPVTCALVGGNRDPRVFDDPEELDVTRERAPHLGFAHGPHFCVGASIARVTTQVALTELLKRDLELAADPATLRTPDPGTYRLTALPVRL